MPAIADLVLRLSGAVSIASAECMRVFADRPDNPRVSVRSASAGRCDIDVVNEAGEICVQIAGLQLQSESAWKRRRSSSSPCRNPRNYGAGRSGQRRSLESRDRHAERPRRAGGVACDGRADGVFSIEIHDKAMESAVSALERVQQETSLKVLRLNIGRGIGKAAGGLQSRRSRRPCSARLPIFPIL